MQSPAILLIFLSSLLFFSCETTSSSDTTNNSSIDAAETSAENGKINYAYLADKFCNCAQSSIQLNVELEKLKKNQQLDLLVERLPEAEKTFKEVVACCENMLLNHTKQKMLKDKIDQVLARKCQKLAPRLRKDLINKLPH